MFIKNKICLKTLKILFLFYNITNTKMVKFKKDIEKMVNPLKFNKNDYKQTWK